MARVQSQASELTRSEDQILEDYDLFTEDEEPSDEEVEGDETSSLNFQFKPIILELKFDPADKKTPSPVAKAQEKEEKEAEEKDYKVSPNPWGLSDPPVVESTPDDELLCASSSKMRIAPSMRHHYIRRRR